ncbi:MAG: SIMPL domain-containing protein [Gemmatimonadetes bacterium]|jgi:uncharacterized protein|nr:SIMPL domain-containing protein [Gemmatimonadota bacterium]MBT6144738.1 SIMPL domain-containing protein [Gemmatimonadota bacterium]MBT7861693.1 SIMPL domain-containing protein [Gemmatimonadota bacterium]
MSIQSRHAQLLAAICVSALFLFGCEGDTILSPDGTIAGEDRIQVTGTAQVAVEPDIATTQVGVQTFDADAVEAVTLNNLNTAAVLAAFEALGIAEQDLQTRSFSISPQRAYAEDRPDSIVGYWVNNTVGITLRDLTKVGEMLQVAVDAGANSIYGLQFGVANPDSVGDLARAKAVEDARRRADTLAEAAGVSVGDVVSLREGSISVPYYRGALESDASSSVPIETGSVEVSATVEAVFSIR